MKKKFQINSTHRKNNQPEAQLNLERIFSFVYNLSHYEKHKAKKNIRESENNKNN